MSFEDYINQVAIPGTWAGRLEAEAAAEALKIRLLIYTSWGEILTSTLKAMILFALSTIRWAIGNSLKGLMSKDGCKGREDIESWGPGRPQGRKSQKTAGRRSKL